MTRSYDYRQKTIDSGNGFTSDTRGTWQAHHILCNHGIAARKHLDDAERVRFLEACLKAGDWDLNNKDNLIGLPTNKQFRRIGFNSDKLDKLCSHQVDHNTKKGYTKEVVDWLKEEVWDTLEIKKNEHGFEPKDIKDQLEDCTADFTQKLKDRGEREGGTKECWGKRFKGSSDFKKKWYHPFSMAQRPNPRNPGEVVNGRMVRIFKKL